MSSRGGSHSPKRATAEEQQRERDVMAEQTKLRAYDLIRQLVDATIPNVVPVEPDVRKRALGVYIAAHLYQPPGDAMVFAHSLLTRELRHRDDIQQLAEEELPQGIYTLDQAEQREVWKLLATA
jgi:hypothetical protein